LTNGLKRKNQLVEPVKTGGSTASNLEASGDTSILVYEATEMKGSDE